ncbi:MAG: hypothetical protein WDO71_18030 [Bacteroidota bacterium]
MSKRLLFSLSCFLLFNCIFAQVNTIQSLLDSLRIAGNFPGLSAAIVSKDNTALAFTSGYNDKEKALL